MNEELKNFIKLSKYFGCRFDVVQAGGGNTSAKLPDGTMIVKASGVYLSEVSENYGYTKVNNSEITNILNMNIEEKEKRAREKIVSEAVNKANYTKNSRPSIETLLHSILRKYVLHSHPVTINVIACRKDWAEVFSSIFKDEKIAFVEYKTPGLDLALELKKVYKGEKIIFLQNHGLIVNADTTDEVIRITEEVLNKTEQFLQIDMQKYKYTSEIYTMLENICVTDKTPWLSEDKFLEENIKNENIFSIPFCPDKMVYCGYKTLNIKGEEDILEYKKKYFDIPKVVVYKNRLFFIANNVKKAKEIEDVFKFHIMSLSLYDNDNINFLSEDEIKYIGNWEAEKYRGNL